VNDSVAGRNEAMATLSPCWSSGLSSFQDSQYPLCSLLDIFPIILPGLLTSFQHQQHKEKEQVLGTVDRIYGKPLGGLCFGQRKLP
jgi:hypothetical protein